MYKALLSIIALFLAGQATMGQVLMPEGSFNKDSLKIGENLEYTLSIKYPKNSDVVFPDSLFDFAPFEFTSKVSFPTRSDSIFSFDSAIYSLTTFEIDSLQILRLPYTHIKIRR